MDFIQHSLNWCKDEIFEGKLVLAFGLLTIVTAFLFWKIGVTQNAKAMLFPLVIVGFLFASVGGGMLLNNPNRIAEFPKHYQKNQDAFIKSEKERVENFKKWYPIARYVMSGIGILGILCFIFWSSSIGRAIGISLLLMTLGAFVVDHFSEERADIYYKKIMQYQKQQDFT